MAREQNGTTNPAERLFACSATLERDCDRMRWLLRQIANDLPQKRDWLNPEYEREMLAWANTGIKVRLGSGTMPACPRCGNNRQVWKNQLTGKLTCHRAFCHTVIKDASNT